MAAAAKRRQTGSTKSNVEKRTRKYVHEQEAVTNLWTHKEYIFLIKFFICKFIRIRIIILKMRSFVLSKSSSLFLFLCCFVCFSRIQKMATLLSKFCPVVLNVLGFSEETEN